MNTKMIEMRKSLGLEGKPLLEEKKDGRCRYGKTRKDKLSSAWANRLVNRDARGEWQKGATKTFPLHTLGGKGNSSVPFKMVRGKGRTQDYNGV